MGWLIVDGSAERCEGYVVGLVKDDGGWRLRELRDTEPIARVDQVQIACDCGWRSPVFTAPVGTDYFPSCTTLGGGEDSEAAAYAIWREHVERDGRKTTMHLLDQKSVEQRKRYDRERPR